MPRTSATQPRYIRITDFGDDGIEPGHEYVTLAAPERKHELELDDVLFARTGSVGKTYLHEDASEPAVFAGYCIRFRFDEAKVLPEFVYWWTKTDAYARWVNAVQRPSVQANINKEEFKRCPIPLPSLDEQRRIVSAITVTRAERKAKLAEADALLAGLDDFVLSELGIDPPQEDNRRVFAVRLGDMSERFDARHHAVKETLRSSFPIVSLGGLTSVEPAYGSSQRAMPRTSATQPRYIRITDFGDDGVEPGHEYVTLDAPERKHELELNDVLFARTGSVGKTYLHEDASEPAIFAGYCILFRFDPAKVLPEFVYWWTKTDAYARWVNTIQRPSVQANINKEEFKRCPIPLPPLDEQHEIVASVRAARERARRLRADAEAGWVAARAGFEAAVVG